MTTTDLDGRAYIPRDLIQWRVAATGRVCHGIYTKLKAHMCPVGGFFAFEGRFWQRVAMGNGQFAVEILWDGSSLLVGGDLPASKGGSMVAPIWPIDGPGSLEEAFESAIVEHTQESLTEIPGVVKGGNGTTLGVGNA